MRQIEKTRILLEALVNPIQSDQCSTIDPSLLSGCGGLPLYKLLGRISAHHSSPQWHWAEQNILYLFTVIHIFCLVSSPFVLIETFINFNWPGNSCNCCCAFWLPSSVKKSLQKISSFPLILTMYSSSIFFCYPGHIVWLKMIFTRTSWIDGQSYSNGIIKTLFWCAH